METSGIDIRASADMVVSRLREGASTEAFAMLDRFREQPLVVREALDRYVAVGADEQLRALRSEGATASPSMVATLDRLERATHEPRAPRYGGQDLPGDLLGLTEAQRNDIYASIVEVRGSEASREALRRNGEAVILGLRRENSTLASGPDGAERAGTGVYDDQLVVLWKDASGERRIHIAHRANTEPTAQYDHNAGSNGGRPLGGPNGAGAARREVTPGFEGVTRLRHIEGRDADADGTYDLGRLEPGTIEMIAATHGGDAHFALRPSQAAVARGQGQVRRDTNGDGYFNTADLEGLDDLNASFKIHRGGLSNTYSAGCQTLHPADYAGFMEAVRSNPAQTRWQYVLTHTTEGIFRNVHTGRGDAAEAAAPEAAPVRPRPGAEPQRQPVVPHGGPEEGGPQAGRRVPRTAEDDYLERFLAVSDRGDHSGRAALTLAYARQPEVRELDRLARSALAGEREQAQAAQERVWQADALRQSPQAMVLGG